MILVGLFRGRVAARLLLASALSALAAPAFGGLCAIQTESGAIVYTNTPTNDGRCASAASSGARALRALGSAGSTEPRFDAMIRNWAGHYQVSPALVHAVVSTESAYNPLAISPKGARGLMQLMPQTAKRYGVRDSFNAEENIRGGVAHLRDLLDSYGGDTRLAVAAYNAGAGAVKRYSGVPPYKETRQYVKSVLSKARASGVRVKTDSAPAAVPAAPIVKTVDASGTESYAN